MTRFYTMKQWQDTLRQLCASPAWQRTIGQRCGDSVMRTPNVPAAIVARAARKARGESPDNAL